MKLSTHLLFFSFLFNDKYKIFLVFHNIIKKQILLTKRRFFHIHREDNGYMKMYDVNVITNPMTDKRFASVWQSLTLKSLSQ